MGKAGTTSPRWLRDVDEADHAIDEAMERVRKRDGRRTYETASSDLLTMFTNTIVYLDGGPDRLLGMLRRLEETHVSRP
jgi:hypothetical protein